MMISVKSGGHRIATWLQSGIGWVFAETKKKGPVLKRISFRTKVNTAQPLAAQPLAAQPLAAQPLAEMEEGAVFVAQEVLSTEVQEEIEPKETEPQETEAPVTIPKETNQMPVSVAYSENPVIKTDGRGNHVEIDVTISRGQKVVITIESKKGSH